MRTVRTPNILPVHSVNVLDGMSIVYVFHILLGSKNFLIFYPFMYILVAYPEHPHGMRDANIPLYIPGISLGWRVLVGQRNLPSHLQSVTPSTDRPIRAINPD
jgi:hypothetical protein